MTYVEPLITGTHAREEFHIFDDFPLPGDDFEDDVTTQLHFQMKKMNGYDESEIARKREALENVLMPESIDSHFSRLKRIGFEKYFTWFKCFNFASIIAFK